MKIFLIFYITTGIISLAFRIPKLQGKYPRTEKITHREDCINIVISTAMLVWVIYLLRNAV